MTNGRVAAIAAITICVAACDAGPPEGGEIGIDTVPAPTVTEATRRVSLQDMVGGTVTGELMITPLPDSAVFRVDLNGAAPETTYGVRIQPGTCEAQGEHVAVLAAVRTGALGNGTSQRSLHEDWQRVMDGRHVVAIYAPTAAPASDRPLACAPLPAM